MPNGRVFPDFQFRTPAKDGITTLWSSGKCPSCGCEVEEANSVNVAVRGLGHIFEREGIVERAIDVEELGYSERFGGAVCLSCYSRYEDGDDDPNVRHCYMVARTYRVEANSEHEARRKIGLYYTAGTGEHGVQLINEAINEFDLIKASKE